MCYEGRERTCLSSSNPVGDCDTTVSELDQGRGCKSQLAPWNLAVGTFVIVRDYY